MKTTHDIIKEKLTTISEELLDIEYSIEFTGYTATYERLFQDLRGCLNIIKDEIYKGPHRGINQKHWQKINAKRDANRKKLFSRLNIQTSS